MSDAPTDIDLLFLGTGTSAGIPMIGCHCPVCTSTDPRDRRSRPSVLISYGDHSILIDTTPELRLQCISNHIDRIDAVVFTHAHADHIMGLDDVRRFNSIIDGPLDVWADPRTHQVLQECFAYAFRHPDPLVKVFRPHLIPRTIGGPFEICGQPWHPVPLLHGDLPILGFRVGRLAYCTDVSRIPEQSWQLLEDLDLLVLDGLRYREHPTHFSIAQAVEAATRIGARQTYLTHLAHDVSHAQAIASLPPGITLAHDGLHVTARC